MRQRIPASLNLIVRLSQMQGVPLDAEIAVIAGSVAAFAAWLATRSSDPERPGWGVRVYCMAFSLCASAAISTPLDDDKSEYRVYCWKEDPSFSMLHKPLFCFK